MIEYEVLVTAVSERADLFQQTIESLLANADVQPKRIIVHEDVRPGSEPGAIKQWLSHTTSVEVVHKVTSPSLGMGPAMLWCLQQATTPIVFYTQEDWLFLRTVPISRALALMEAHQLHHIRFNKRKTMRAKHADTDHPWAKIEVEFDVSGNRVEGDLQKLCISDHWYTQASLWRVEKALPGIAAAQGKPQANAFVPAFNDYMNSKYGDGRAWNDQQMRHEKLRTYIWGPVAEPAFIKHLGSVRTTGPIVHVGGA